MCTVSKYLMKIRRQNRITDIRLVIVCLFLGFVSCFIFLPLAKSKTFVSDTNPNPTPKKKTPSKSSATSTKFKDFPHSARQHSKLACNTCHKFPSANWKQVRKKDEAFPDITDYPKHESCLSCHRRDFYGSPKPTICAVCHSNSSPRNNTRFAFPNPREIFDKTPKGKQAVSDFAISFPHETHIEIVSKNETGKHEFINASFSAKRKIASEESCAVCHQTYQPQGDSDDEYFTKPPANLGDNFWLKKGTFKTVPTSHTTCFTCHSVEVGILPAPSNCAACHKTAPKLANTDFDAKFAVKIGDLDKLTLNAWRKRDSSATFRHEFSSHAEQECANCHNVATIKTLEASTKKVAITSCNLCHITETSDDGGILNYEIDERKKDLKFQCVKCHIAFGKMPIPESHFKAITGQ